MPNKKPMPKAKQSRAQKTKAAAHRLGGRVRAKAPKADPSLVWGRLRRR